LGGPGTIGGALPYLFNFGGQQSETAQVGSMVVLFEPVCGGVCYVIYAESLSSFGVIGAAPVLIRICLAGK
jgi:drug/metabolite transporter (DMT)-like permease